MNDLIMSWSGGKDSALCLYKMIQERQPVGCLLTNINRGFDRISMHGVRRSLLETQALAIGLPLELVSLPDQPDMKDFEEVTRVKIEGLRAEGYRGIAFGDIFLEDLKEYRQRQMQALQMECYFPLWKADPGQLMEEFLGLGFKAIVVCVNSARLDESFCGREIDRSFVRDLPAGVDICGENGEYHSFVYDGPIFSRAVDFRKGNIDYKEYRGVNGEKPAGFYFCDLLSI